MRIPPASISILRALVCARSAVSATFSSGATGNASFVNDSQPVCSGLFPESNLKLILESHVILCAMLTRQETVITDEIRPANGERDMIRTVTSKSKVNKHWLPDMATSEHHATAFAVLPSEIEQLPDLVAFLKLASSPSWRRVQIQRP
jgi:hypothetical protein